MWAADCRFESGRGICFIDRLPLHLHREQSARAVNPLGCSLVAPRLGKDGLTVKQRKTVKGVIEGKTVTQAALDAGYGNTPEAASVSGSRALNKARATMGEALDKKGIGLDAMADEIKRGLAEAKMGKHDSYLKLAMQAHGVLDAAEGGQVIGVGFFIMRGMKERGIGGELA